MPFIECVIPVLPVADMARSVAFYAGVLGFAVDWGCGEGDTLGSVSRDKHALMLSQEAGERPRNRVWIGLEDDSLFDAVRRHGVKVLQEPTNQPWAYEMKIEDPDGHVLWFGTEPKPEQNP